MTCCHCPIRPKHWRVCEHIDDVQTTLGRQMLLENPSTYLAFVESSWSEVDFIAEVARRTGCGLLLDVNNVYVASINQQQDPTAYIDAYPLAHVQQIHLAGYASDADDKGRPLLIDADDRQVADIVWSMNAAEYWVLLVHERSWTSEQFQAWVTDAWARLLLT